MSRKLLDNRDQILEKEYLAMKWAIKTLKYYLLGQHFILEILIIELSSGYII